MTHPLHPRPTSSIKAEEYRGIWREWPGAEAGVAAGNRSLRAVVLGSFPGISIRWSAYEVQVWSNGNGADDPERCSL